jgi:hypothetical protein
MLAIGLDEVKNQNDPVTQLKVYSLLNRLHTQLDPVDQRPPSDPNRRCALRQCNFDSAFAGSFELQGTPAEENIVDRFPPYRPWLGEIRLVS